MKRIFLREDQPSQLVTLSPGELTSITVTIRVSNGEQPPDQIELKLSAPRSSPRVKAATLVFKTEEEAEYRFVTALLEKRTLLRIDWSVDLEPSRELREFHGRVSATWKQGVTGATVALGLSLVLAYVVLKPLLDGLTFTGWLGALLALYGVPALLLADFLKERVRLLVQKEGPEADPLSPRAAALSSALALGLAGVLPLFFSVAQNCAHENVNLGGYWEGGAFPINGIKSVLSVSEAWDAQGWCDEAGATNSNAKYCVCRSKEECDQKCAPASSGEEPLFTSIVPWARPPYMIRCASTLWSESLTLGQVYGRPQLVGAEASNGKIFVKQKDCVKEEASAVVTLGQKASITTLVALRHPATLAEVQALPRIKVGIPSLMRLFGQRELQLRVATFEPLSESPVEAAYVRWSTPSFGEVELPSPAAVPGKKSVQKEADQNGTSDYRPFKAELMTGEGSEGIKGSLECYQEANELALIAARDLTLAKAEFKPVSIWTAKGASEVGMLCAGTSASAVEALTLHVSTSKPESRLVLTRKFVPLQIDVYERDQQVGRIECSLHGGIAKDAEIAIHRVELTGEGSVFDARDEESRLLSRWKRGPEAKQSYGWFCSAASTASVKVGTAAPVAKVTSQATPRSEVCCSLSTTGYPIVGCYSECNRATSAAMKAFNGCTKGCP